MRVLRGFLTPVFMPTRSLRYPNTHASTFYGCFPIIKKIKCISCMEQAALRKRHPPNLQSLNLVLKQIASGYMSVRLNRAKITNDCSPHTPAMYCRCKTHFPLCWLAQEAG